MRFEITGIVNKVFNVRSSGKGFTQAVILHQPSATDEFKRVVAKEQFFVVSIWSNKETDSRFLNNSHLNKKKSCSVYLYGERWPSSNGGDFQYNNKLNLQDWKTD
jgi:hypothetical protein